MIVILKLGGHFKIFFLSQRASFPPPPQEAEDRLKKKRERNRIAATKCRQRKIEKIFTLGKMKEIQHF